MLVVVAACLVALLAGACVLLYWRGNSKAHLASLALNNMSQGVVMFDAAGARRRLQQPLPGNLWIVAGHRKARRQAHRYRPPSLCERQPRPRSGAVLRRADGPHGVRKDIELRVGAVRRTLRRRRQSRHPRRRLLAGDASRHHRAARRRAKERAVERAGIAARRHRGRHRLVSRQRRGRAARPSPRASRR